MSYLIKYLLATNSSIHWHLYLIPFHQSSNSPKCTLMHYTFWVQIIVHFSKGYRKNDILNQHVCFQLVLNFWTVCSARLYPFMRIV